MCIYKINRHMDCFCIFSIAVTIVHCTTASIIQWIGSIHHEGFLCSKWIEVDDIVIQLCSVIHFLAGLSDCSVNDAVFTLYLWFWFFSV